MTKKFLVGHQLCIKQTYINRSYFVFSIKMLNAKRKWRKLMENNTAQVLSIVEVPLCEFFIKFDARKQEKGVFQSQPSNLVSLSGRLCDIILIFLLFNYSILYFSSPSPAAIIIASVYVCLFFGWLVGLSGNFIDSRIHESKLFLRKAHPAVLQELHAGKGSIRQSLVHEYLLLPPLRYIF